ncbi:unnamed protein product [Symbiodinium sp. CCMP2456]|nr:unnamed protein product [Symbiodinium sp. CCMP2456]
MTGLEVPRWVTRLGSYLAQGRGDLSPSPLAGSMASPQSPPGGPAFRLRSPTRTTRPLPPPTPPSSDISAEAIQAEVQRQLGGILGRLQVAESRNEALMSELGEARRVLEAAYGDREGNFQEISYVTHMIYEDALLNLQLPLGYWKIFLQLHQVPEFPRKNPKYQTLMQQERDLFHNHLPYLKLEVS